MLALSLTSIYGGESFLREDDTLSFSQSMRSLSELIAPTAETQAKRIEDLLARAKGVVPRSNVPTHQDIENAIDFLVTYQSSGDSIIRKEILYAALEGGAGPEVFYNEFSRFLGNIAVSFFIYEDRKLKPERKKYEAHQGYTTQNKIGAAVYKTSEAYYHFQVLQHFINMFVDSLILRGIKLEGDYPVLYVYEQLNRGGRKIYTPRIKLDRNLRCIDKIFFSKDKHGYVAYTSRLPNTNALMSYLSVSMAFGEFGSLEPDHHLIFAPIDEDTFRKKGFLEAVDTPGIFIDAPDSQELNISLYKGITTANIHHSMIKRGFYYARNLLGSTVGRENTAILALDSVSGEVREIKGHAEWEQFLNKKLKSPQDGSLYKKDGRGYTTFIPKSSGDYIPALAHLINVLNGLNFEAQILIKDLLIDFCSELQVVEREESDTEREGVIWKKESSKGKSTSEKKRSARKKRKQKKSIQSVSAAGEVLTKREGEGEIEVQQTDEDRVAAEAAAKLAAEMEEGSLEGEDDAVLIEAAAVAAGSTTHIESGWIEEAGPSSEEESASVQGAVSASTTKGRSRQKHSSADTVSVRFEETHKDKIGIEVEKFSEVLLDEIPEGRLNADNTLKIVNALIEIATSNSALRVKRINQVGSHTYFHFHNGPTYCHVIKHGKKDRTVSAGQLKSAAREIAAIAVGAGEGRAEL